MPELPEVETVVRGLTPDLVGAVFGEATVGWEKVLDGWDLADFNRRVVGCKVTGIHRRGKYICISLDSGDFIVVHLRMTGRLYVSALPQGGDKWVRYTQALADERFLHFSDARKFGRVSLVASLDFLEEKLGPEPLTLKAADFKRILRGSRRAIKTFLLDQKYIAGVGNIYADESLFQARIHPLRPVDELNDTERARLGRCVKASLEAGISHEGASINWYRKADGGKGDSQEHFLVYGQDGKPCQRCPALIEKIVVGQRGTHFCSKCQS